MKMLLITLSLLACAFVFAFAVVGWKDSRCERWCSPNSFETLGRDGICVCLVKLPTGETCLSRPEPR